jgi:hypothetical protein
VAHSFFDTYESHEGRYKEIREMVQLGILFIYLLLLCGWGYIVALTKVLKICQIYHTWIHPFHIQRVYESIITNEYFYNHSLKIRDAGLKKLQQ